MSDIANETHGDHFFFFFVLVKFLFTVEEEVRYVANRKKIISLTIIISWTCFGDASRGTVFIYVT